jgi:hypothetical protein
MLSTTLDAMAIANSEVLSSIVTAVSVHIGVPCFAANARIVAER